MNDNDPKRSAIDTPARFTTADYYKLRFRTPNGDTRLTPYLASLLFVLFANAGRLVSYADIFDFLLQSGAIRFSSRNSLSTHLHRLRRICPTINIEAVFGQGLILSSHAGPSALKVAA